MQIPSMGEHRPFMNARHWGGENSLRAFGGSRFIDSAALVINLEERVLIRQQKSFGYLLDFQVAPFLDVGRVESHFDSNMILKPQVNPGWDFDSWPAPISWAGWMSHMGATDQIFSPDWIIPFNVAKSFL